MIRQRMAWMLLAFTLAACTSGSGGEDYVPPPDDGGNGSVIETSISSDVASLLFQSMTGQTPPAQTLAISFEGSGVDAGFGDATAPTWLQIVGTPTGAGAINYSVTVTPPAGSSEQTLTAVLRFSTARADGSGLRTVDVPVTYQITSAAVPVSISATPASLNFKAVAGEALPQPQVIQVSFAGGDFLVTRPPAETPPEWLQIHETLADSNARTLQVSVTSTSLAPQTLRTTIRLATVPADVSEAKFIDVPVEYEVLAEFLTITALPVQVQFSAASGGALPPAQTVTVSYTGSGATVQSAPAWVDVTPVASAASPQAFQIRPKTTAYIQGAVFTGDVVFRTSGASGDARTAGAAIRYDIGAANSPTAYNRYLPLKTVSGEMKLIDPDNAAAPLTVDTGVATQNGIGHVKAGIFDATRGGLADGRFEHIVYVRGGQVLTISLQKGAGLPAPRRISSVTDACMVSVISDYANIQNSLIVIHTRRDGQCGPYAGPVYSRFSDNQTLPPRTIELQQFTAPRFVRDANGGIAAFIELERLPGDRQQLVRWDKNLQNKQVVSILPAGTFTTLEMISPAAGGFYLTEEPLAGLPDPSPARLLRYDDATRQITTLYTYGGTFAGDIKQKAAVDGNYLYFVDGISKLLRVGHRSTGAVTLFEKPADELIAASVMLSGERIVFSLYKSGDNPTSRAVSIPKAGGALQTAAVDLPWAARFDYVSDGWIYTSMPAGSTARRAVAVRLDGSERKEFENGTWDFATAETDFALLGWNGYYEVKNIVLSQRVAGGTHTKLTSFDAATASPVAALGEVVGSGEWMVGQSNPAAAYGRNLMFLLFERSQNGGNFHNDVYYADMEKTGSLLPVGVSTEGSEETVLGTAP